MAINQSTASTASARLRRGILVFFIALVALGCVSEALLRFGLGLGNPVLITPDAACAYTLKPGQNVFRFFQHTRTNRYAMRSDEVPAVRAPGALRLMFVGDSVTYGTSQVDQSRIFTELVHHDLPSIVHRPVEVLNASAGAWAIDNELSYIRSRGVFQSDFVLLVLNDGDVTQSRATMAEVGDGLPQKRPATAIGELWTRYLKPRMLHMARRVDAGDSVDENAESVKLQNLADLDSFNQLVTGAGARLVIVFVPFRKDIPDKCASARSTLQAWTSARHLPMVDLTSAELGYPVKQITLDGEHLNAKGNEVAAQTLERALQELIGH